MIQAIVIDDEPLARAIVLEYLQKYPNIQVIAECADGFEGVKKIEELKPDLVFLDIQMPKISGFEMLELLDHRPAVIFATAFDEYAIKAFDNHAIDYLLKPFSQERFEQAMQKWQTNYQGKNIKNEGVENFLAQSGFMASAQNRIVVKVRDKIKIIPTADLLFIEASGDFVKIHTSEGVFLKSKTMAYFESSLDSSLFVRIHRSYILHITELTRLELYEKDSYLAVLKNSQKIPVSKAGYSKLKHILGI
jgi:two-component system, LytTR family, response regulator